MTINYKTKSTLNPIAHMAADFEAYATLLNRDAITNLQRGLMAVCPFKAKLYL